MGDSDDECDVWEYKPLNRGRKKGSKHKSSTKSHNIAQTQSSQESRHQPKRGCKAEKKKTQVKSDTRITPAAEKNHQKGKTGRDTGLLENEMSKKKHSGFCPVCQMPFGILMIQSPSWHVAECLQLPIMSSQECPEGTRCDVTIESHYRKYRHTLLAGIRAGSSCSTQIATVNNDEAGDKETPIDQAKRKLTFSTWKPQEDKAQNEAIPCEQDDNLVETPVEIAKKKLNFSVNKTMTMKEETEQCLCGSNTDENFGEHDIDQAKRKLTFNSTQKVTIKGANSESILSNLPIEEVCSHCLKRKLSANDQGSPAFFPVNVDTPKVKSERGESSVAVKIENIVSLSNTAKDLGDGSDRGYQSDEDIFKEEVAENMRTEEISGLQKQVETCPEGTTRFDENSLSVPKHFYAKLKEQSFSSSQPPSTQKSPALQRKETSFKRLGKNAKQPSISAFFTTKPQRQGVNAQGKVSSSANTSQNLLASTSKVSSMSVLDEKHQNGQTGTQANETNESPVLTYKFTTKTTVLPEKNHNCDIDTCDEPDSTADEIPVKLRKKSLTENVTTLLTNAMNKTKSALDLLKYNPESKPWPLRTSRTSKAGPSNSTTEVPKESFTDEGATQRGRKCPFYKKIPGTPFTVDAFKYGSIPGCTAYFLSHFHYDHYGGLKKSFAHPIYCSKVTANLVEKKIRVASQYIRAINLHTPTVIDGVEVTFLDANHCPGSVLILFKLRDGTVHLHTGDFRASEEMTRYPQLQGLSIDTLYLDTTYCDPVYSFPPQKDVIQFSVNKAVDFLHANPNTLVVVGSYTIGKERIFLAIAEALNVKVCVTREKKGILDCLEDASIDQRLTLKMTEARVHVLPMKQLNYMALEEYLGKLKPRFDKVLAFEPTGWTHSKKTTGLDNIKPKVQRGSVTLYGVPYSEHSSYTEMKSFTQFTKPRKVLPTVNNANPTSRRKMEELFASWKEEQQSSPQKQLKQRSMNGWLKS